METVEVERDGALVLVRLYAWHNGMDMAVLMIASGVLDRRPGLRLLISEAGAPGRTRRAGASPRPAGHR